MRAGPPAASGLTDAEARLRRERAGPNAIAAARRRPAALELLANLVQLFALLLWAGALLALVGGMPELAVAIVAVIVVNAVFAFVQEHRAERAAEALRGMLPPRARVRRGGVEREIPAEDVVPGDRLLLSAGDRVSADADLAWREELRVDESVLTGESRPVRPDAAVFAGTHVVAGRAEAVVTATGMATRFGGIAHLAQGVRRARSPLERELGRVTRLVAVVAVGIGVAFFLLAGLLGMGVSDRFLFAVGVTVALVPEGLLPSVTLALSMATQRMARRDALVRRLSSVEALGATTVICTDKTGTLTANAMTVERVWSGGRTLAVEGSGYEPFGRFLADGAVVRPHDHRELLRAGLLCNDARLVMSGGAWEVAGDPTEGALVVLAEKGGLRHEEEAAHAPRLAEVPFTSERRRMTTVHRTATGRVAYVKGAVESVLKIARAGGGQRAAAIEADVELLGVVGMSDPPRPEVPRAVARCRRAGIRVVMVTGDSGATGAAIARQVGLVDATAPVRVITGAEMAGLGDDAVLAAVRDGQVVFARIDPEEKLRLATLLRADGEVVAMTGDGVNDAPALRHADIGVAMGRGGTDVAREAADLILLDDDFSSVAAAVEEGRAVFDNIRRFAGYHFCSNGAELIPFLVWGMSGGAVPLPLVVMQVLAIDLGTDLLPALALGTERPEPGTMERPPRSRRERLLDRATLRRVALVIAPVQGALALAAFAWAMLLAGWRPWEAMPDEGTAYLTATTMTMAAIMMGQVGAAFAWRSDRRSIRAIGPFTNRLLLVGVAVAVAAIAVLSYAPGAGRVFHTAPLAPEHWLALAGVPLVVLAVDEARKALVRRARAGAASG